MAPMDPSATLFPLSLNKSEEGVLPLSMQKSEAASACATALSSPPASGNESCLSNLLQGLQEMPYLKYFSSAAPPAHRFSPVVSDSPMLGDLNQSQVAKCDYSTVTSAQRVDSFLNHIALPPLEIDPVQQQGSVRFASDACGEAAVWSSSALGQSSPMCDDLQSVIPPSSFESPRGVIPSPATVPGVVSAAVKAEPLQQKEKQIVSEQRNVARQAFQSFTPEMSDETSFEGLLRTSSTMSSSSGSQVRELDEEDAVCTNTFPVSNCNPAAAAVQESLLRENFASLTHAMLYRSVFPSAIDLAAVKNSRPKRRNVKISKDPQSVAARHRRERISDRIRVLQRLVPGGTKMDTASMLDEAISYVKFLKAQVQTLESVSNAAGGFDPRFGFGAGPFLRNSTLPYHSISSECQGLSPAPEHAHGVYGPGTPFHPHGSFPDAFREQFCH